MALGLGTAAWSAAAIEPSDVLAFSAGPVSIRPQLGAYSEFNDNIFYRTTNTVSDLIFGLAPGVRFLIGDDLPRVNHVGLQYRADQSFFFDNSSLNALQHRVTLDLYFGTERTTLEGVDRWEILESTLSGGFSSVTGIKVGRLVAHDLYRVDYRVGERTGVYVEGEHDAIDYNQGILLFDTRAIQGTAGFQWSYSPYTRIFGEAYYGMTTVESNSGAVDPPGNSFVGGFVGARGTFTEKLTGVLKAGYEYYKFESRGALAGGSDSGSAPVVAADIAYQITERTTLAMTYSRRQRVSSEYTRLAYVIDDMAFRASMIIGSTGKLRAEAGSRLAFYAYESSPAITLPARQVVHWTSTVGARWLFKPWLSSRLDYQYSMLRSDSSSVTEYAQNRVTISVLVGY